MRYTQGAAVRPFDQLRAGTLTAGQTAPLPDAVAGVVRPRAHGRSYTDRRSTGSRLWAGAPLPRSSACGVAFAGAGAPAHEVGLFRSRVRENAVGAQSRCAQCGWHAAHTGRSQTAPLPDSVAAFVRPRTHGRVYTGRRSTGSRLWAGAPLPRPSACGVAFAGAGAPAHEAGSFRSRVRESAVGA